MALSLNLRLRRTSIGYSRAQTGMRTPLVVVVRPGFENLLNLTPSGSMIYESGCQEKYLPVGRQPGHNDTVEAASPSFGLCEPMCQRSRNCNA
jgi:hypothetical protein